jgi:hypothetical protein
MARRKKSDAGGMNLDSLMDTLTNVVGVLIIILILVEINVSRAVKKIISELPPITIEEHAKLKETVQEKIKVLEDLKTAQTDAKQINEQLEKANAEFAMLNEGKPRDVKLVDVDTLKKQLDTKEKDLAAKKAEMAKLLAEQERLQALLASTPAPVPVAPVPSKVVRIPNSRPVPDKAKFARVIVSAGQLFVLDLDAAERLVMSEFNRAKHTLEASRAKDAKGKTVVTYDQDKVVKYFAQRTMALSNVTITVPYNKTSTRLVMKLTAKPGTGEPVEIASRLTSRTYAMLRQARGGNTVVWFQVARDSFETYIRAREIVDAIGVPAGWDVASEPAYAVVLTDFTVTQMEKPPEAPPPDPTKPVIPPPKKTLD